MTCVGSMVATVDPWRLSVPWLRPLPLCDRIRVCTGVLIPLGLMHIEGAGGGECTQHPEGDG